MRGKRPVPAWIDIDTLPSDFAAHVNATPTVVATDGGVIDTGDEGELLDEEPVTANPITAAATQTCQ